MSTEVWNKFKRRYSNVPICKSVFDSTIIYALPGDLIQILEDGNLLEGKAIEFEWELAGLTGGGFWKGNRFGYAPLNEEPEIQAKARAGEQLDRRIAASLQKLEELLQECDASEGLPVQVGSNRRKRQEAYRAEASEMQVAFAGWLIMNPTFRAERDLMREKWERCIQDAGTFPLFPISLFGEPPHADDGFTPECTAVFRFFYRRWGLEQFVTWDLPLAMHPEIGSILYGLSEPTSNLARGNALAMSDAGAVMHLPWCMLRQKTLNLHSLLAANGFGSGPAHVAEWLGLKGSSKKALGPKRLGLNFRIYRYWELAIKPRYGERLKRKMQHVNTALGEFLETDAENAKRAREALQRALSAPVAFENASADLRRLLAGGS